MLNMRLFDDSSPDTSKTAETDSDAPIGAPDLPSSGLGMPEGHNQRVAIYAVAIGKRLDLPEETLSALRSAAVLHDIGKVGISRQIVEKLGQLTDREFEIMRLHSTIAIRMLERVEGLQDSLPMIKHHHERYDGKGYPDGLEGHDIPLGARIIGVAETFDMLVSDLPWRDALPLNEALKELKENAGTQFDPMVVEAFVSAIRDKQVDLPDEIAEQLEITRPPKTN